MKKRTDSPFTLVRQVGLQEAPSLVEKLASATASTMDAVTSKARQILNITPQRTLKVGILDLSAWVTRLPDLLERLNKSQALLRFYEVQAPIPAGMLMTEQRLVAWVQEHLARELTVAERGELKRNIFFNDFAVAAEDIRKSPGVEADYLVGITPAMVAGDSGEKISWNNFSFSAGHVVMVSTAELREFAAEAQRPFEAAVGLVMVATLLAEMTPGFDFHSENRGCIFDANEDRKSIVRNIREPHIEGSCLERLPEDCRAAAVAMTQALDAWKEHG